MYVTQLGIREFPVNLATSEEVVLGPKRRYGGPLSLVTRFLRRRLLYFALLLLYVR